MKTTLLTLINILLTTIILAQPPVPENSKYGVLFMAGARYDDVRRCVATSPGTKGGPMADIMLTRTFKLSANKTIRLNLPVMRPLLFALAFKMLQFEPEANLFFTSPNSEHKKLFLSPGLGFSLNYGPDYMSNNDSNADRFFSFGPTFSLQTGLKFNHSNSNSAAVRFFYTPLFANGTGKNGTVLGASLQYWFRWGK